jgi:hypothetical protein
MKSTKDDRLYRIRTSGGVDEIRRRSFVGGRETSRRRKSEEKQITFTKRQTSAFKLVYLVYLFTFT